MVKNGKPFFRHIKVRTHSFPWITISLPFQVKKFFNFFDVADRMNLCGRNVAFPVWEGTNLIE